MELVPASTLSLSELTALFNATYRGYPVPARLDEPALRRHLSRNDVSRIAVDGSRASFALIAQRGSAAWVGGMGTVPAGRRTGLGERTLTSASEAAKLTGTTTASLEVLDENPGARALYGKLGFVATRRLLVCTLRGPTTATSAQRQLQLDEAHSWIVAHRDAPEPWQRADASLRHIRAESGRLVAIGVEHHDEITAAVIYADERASISILQIAGRDPAAAATALQAVVGAADGRPTRLTNVAADGTIAAAAQDLGAAVDHIQWEMQWRSPRRLRAVEAADSRITAPRTVLAIRPSGNTLWRLRARGVVAAVKPTGVPALRQAPGARRPQVHHVAAPERLATHHRESQWYGGERVCHHDPAIAIAIENDVPLHV